MGSVLKSPIMITDLSISPFHSVYGEGYFEEDLLTLGQEGGITVTGPVRSLGLQE